MEEKEREKTERKRRRGLGKERRKEEGSRAQNLCFWRLHGRRRREVAYVKYGRK